MTYILIFKNESDNQDETFDDYEGAYNECNNMYSLSELVELTSDEFFHDFNKVNVESFLDFAKSNSTKAKERLINYAIAKIEK